MVVSSMNNPSVAVRKKLASGQSESLLPARETRHQTASSSSNAPLDSGPFVGQTNNIFNERLISDGFRPSGDRAANKRGRTVLSKRVRQALRMRNPLMGGSRRHHQTREEEEEEQEEQEKDENNRINLKKRVASDPHDVAETSSYDESSQREEGEASYDHRKARNTTRSSSSLEFIVDQLNKKLTTFGKRLIKVLAALLIINLIVYLAPMKEPQIEPRTAPPRPRPQFTGPLAVNEQLDESEVLFKDQFHAPESMAWRADKRAFYTGVEGGFILLVEPFEERWQVVVRLNSRNSALDLSHNVSFVDRAKSGREERQDAPAIHPASQDNSSRFVPFCDRDIKLYGSRAEFEPSLVSLSRCSRPLGVRLAPNESHLYVSDSLAGLYRVDLASGRRPQVSKLVDFSQYQDISQYSDSSERIVFADDIAVNWAANPDDSDVVYMTDCSRRWSVRYLIRLMIENEASGRVISFRVNERQLEEVGPINPVKLVVAQTGPFVPSTTRSIKLDGSGSLDWRNLSFPNGIELTANKSALLISDLNNRRILMHHLLGPLAGQTEHLLWAAGYADNVRRGLDLADGRPTYWAACGCAVGDGRFEIAEFFNQYPIMRKILLKHLHYIGAFIEWLGSTLHSTKLVDTGFQIKAAWLKTDPYCTHGLVFQFTEQGQLLRSLHAPHFSSNFKLLSEAHQVPLLPATLDDNNSSLEHLNDSNQFTSALYLGSVYYSYLGRVKLGPIK